jgi:hypothetical protein
MIKRNDIKKQSCQAKEYKKNYQSVPTCPHFAEQAKRQHFAPACRKTCIFPKYGNEWRQQNDPYLQLKICRSTNLRQRQQGIYTQRNIQTDKQEART